MVAKGLESKRLKKKFSIGKKFRRSIQAQSGGSSSPHSGSTANFGSDIASNSPTASIHTNNGGEKRPELAHFNFSNSIPSNQTNEFHSNKNGSKPQLVNLNYSSNSIHKEANATMFDVLNNKSGFEAFIQHCLSEMSVENILFIVEIGQFKGMLLKHNVPEKLDLDAMTNSSNNNNNNNETDATGLELEESNINETMYQMSQPFRARTKSLSHIQLRRLFLVLVFCLFV